MFTTSCKPSHELTSCQTIATVTITVPILKPQQLSNLDAWLRSILWDSKLPNLKSAVPDPGSNKLEIHRLKAKLSLSNGDVKIVQGVREVFDILDAPKSNPTTAEDSPKSGGKIVVIGRNLVSLPFEESFINTIQSS